MVDHGFEEDTPLGSISDIAARAFGITGERENASFVEGYEDNRRARKERDASGFVDSMQRAESLAPNALKFTRGALDEATFGVATGIIPGHMSRDPETVAARRDLQAPIAGREERVQRRAMNQEPEASKPKATGFQALYDQTFGKGDEGRGDASRDEHSMSR